MRIAHISDLHVACSPGFGEYNAKRLLGYVNYRLFRRRRYRESVAAAALEGMMAKSPDLVILTGDITQHGLEAEFKQARTLLSVLTDNRISVITASGNHDFYGGSDSGALNHFITDMALGQRADAYGLYHFPGVELLVLGQGIVTPPFFAYGRQDPEELSMASRVWSTPADGVMRIVCGHYPVINPQGERLLHFHGLRQAELLIDFCREHRVAGYFCGHKHKRFTARMPGGCIQYSAPALSLVKDADKEWISVYECVPGATNPVETGHRASAQHRS